MNRKTIFLLLFNVKTKMLPHRFTSLCVSGLVNLIFHFLLVSRLPTIVDRENFSKGIFYNKLCSSSNIHSG